LPDLPFEDNNVASLLDKIVMGRYVPFPKSFSKNLRDLLTSILITNPYKRLSLIKITTHPWFTE
jgi:serine/threonine protein kinase